MKTAVEYCNGDDDDGDGASDEGCRSCDMVVTRRAREWAALTCVMDGAATGAPLVPVAIGSKKVLGTSAEVAEFISARKRHEDRLGVQIVAARLNRDAFRVGGATVGDIDGDGVAEDLDAAIALADDIHDEGSNKEQRLATRLLRRFNKSGRKLPAWFDESCRADPELCDDVDNDADGRVDEACLCAPDDEDEEIPEEPCPGTPTDDEEAEDEVGPTLPRAWYADVDGDGHGDGSVALEACEPPAGFVDVGDDCDDADATAFPGATETCDDVDDDCDGVVDDAASDASAWYADADGDGYGDPSASTQACDAPAGSVATATDCDDADATAFPGATETCDDVDDDCDGVVDEDDATDAPTWYLDADADGYGDVAVPHRSCDAPEGYLADAADCDDHSAAASPGLPERCDEIDNDCDGTVDEADAEDALDLYADADGDGHGDAGASIHACPSSGAVRDSSDCDDTRGTTWPGAPEYCNGYDDDCDGAIDLYAIDMRVYYYDGDGDGYGDAMLAVESCGLPGQHSARGTDCDDADPELNPAATETCDGIDQDCDGEIDEDASDAIDWYTDADADGHGLAGAAVEACEAPDGTSATDDDCDDAAADRFPGNPEVCDEIDNDCDDRVDVDAEGAPTVYRDADGDGFGRASAALTTCDPPDGYVTDATDCNDGRASTHPGAAESCDAADNDCDEEIDDEVPWYDWYADADGDAYGDAADVVSACAQPEGYVADASDCDDRDDTALPGGTETCDGADNDCDGVVDDPEELDWTTWNADADGDDHGDVTTAVSACRQPSGYVADDADCDDADAEIHPGAAEQCDEIDNDCDGTVDEAESGQITVWYTDADGDGEGDPTSTVRSCIPLDGIVTTADDCDDTDAQVFPGADELCNATDDDCDGTIDEGPPADATHFYRDADGDGHGDPNDVAYDCAAPTGYVDDDDDCDDADPDRSPSAAESCNGVDDDCDDETDEGAAIGATAWYADVDGDGVGSDTTTRTACERPEGWLPDPGDCDDRDAAVLPGASEVCNDVDDDCDGAVDEETSVGERAFYADADGDGYGDPAVALISCSTPDGYVEDAADCDDTDGDVSPGASEVCNDVDDDCDGSTDGGDAGHPSNWYRDADGDGYGDAAERARACTAPVGYVADDADCDDQRAEVSPAEIEVCGNQLDDDCDGVSEWCGPYGARSLAAADATFPGEFPGDGLGRAVAIAPDLDGDGLDEVVVGGIGIDKAAPNGGGALVYAGDLAGDIGVGQAVGVRTGEVVAGYAGRSLSGLGDVDGDGFGDLLVGAYEESTTATAAGAAYFLSGPVTGASSLFGSEARLLGAAEGDWAGYLVASAGNVDGQGGADMLVSAPYEDTAGTRAGAVYLWAGVPDGDVSLAGARARLVGEAALDRAGTGMAGPGDIDGDGIDDLAIGAWSNVTSGIRSGAVYLVYGPVTGAVSLSTADAKLTGTAHNHRAGIAVAGAGDMDGDGLMDVLVGADLAPAAYLVTAAPLGVSSLGDAAAVLKGEQTTGHAGWAVAGAGDVDGDGARDVLVGAYAQASGTEEPGRTYLVCGPVEGTILLSRADGLLSGEGDLDESGYSVAGGGDVDGDGLSDLLIGAWAHDGNGTNAGTSYLMYGAAR